jgi:hypothetical protein
MTITPEDKKTLIAALKDMSASFDRVSAEKDLQKNVINDTCKTLDLNKKVFRKLAKTYHKQNFGEEVQTHEEFEELYESVSKP